MSQPTPQTPAPRTEAYWTVRYRRPGERPQWRSEDWGTRDNADHKYEHLQRTGYDVELIEVMTVLRRKGSAIIDSDVEHERDNV